MSQKNVETIWHTRWTESISEQYKKITNIKHKELVIWFSATSLTFGGTSTTICTNHNFLFFFLTLSTTNCSQYWSTKIWILHNILVINHDFIEVYVLSSKYLWLYIFGLKQKRRRYKCITKTGGANIISNLFITLITSSNLQLAKQLRKSNTSGPEISLYIYTSNSTKYVKWLEYYLILN